MIINQTGCLNIILMAELKKKTAEIYVTAVVFQQSQTKFQSSHISNKYTVQALHVWFLCLWNAVTLPETLK